jgi:hypothetical protein
MNPSPPRVSVLLAVHNDARFLPATLASLFGQTMTDFELVTVDDASTDATAALLRGIDDPRLRYLRNERNLGQVPSLNRGLADCRGEFVARIDGDDVCEPDRFREQLAYLEARPALIGCATWTTEIDPDDHVIGAQEPPDDAEHVRWSLCHTNRLYHPSMMLRRAALVEASGYDERFPASEDYELWTRLIAGGARIGVVPRRLLRYRRRPGSISDVHRDRQRTFTRRIAARYVSALLGRTVDEATVSLMAGLLSWQRPTAQELSAALRSGLLQRSLQVMRELRRRVLQHATLPARRAGDDEVATHLDRLGRLLLREAPAVSLRLAGRLAHLPRHRCRGLSLVAAAARCLATAR